MRIPRDIGAEKLIAMMKRHGYQITRQRGSHIRLERNEGGKVHRISIPNHNPVKVGTLHDILQDLARNLEISIEDLVSKL